MRTAGLLLAFVAILTLNLILLIGASTDPPRPPWFGVLTATMDVSLVVSSAVLGGVLVRRGRRFFGLLFLSNLVLILGAFVLRLTGLEFRPVLLFGADLYWLNLYLIGISREWRELNDPVATQ
jgi:hypothetical protein